MTQPSSTYTATQALTWLKEGNERFIRGEARFPTMQKEVFAQLAKRQEPFATILGCSDSRVPPELIFDAGFGELFVIRVAGNVLGDAIAGTLQYAGKHLHTPLFVVMGHEGCGAVSAAVEMKLHGARLESRIEVLLEEILPALEGIDTQLPGDALLRAAVEANVRRTVSEILQSPEAKIRDPAGNMMLDGAIYELESGRVRFLD
jgi:carbonic anhydrase